MYYPFFIIMITPIEITLDLMLPLDCQDISVFHIQTAFNNNIKPLSPLNQMSGIFYAIKFIEYTDYKNRIMNNLLTSCRMSLLNKLQYEFI
jgi:hypothetical protein